MHGHFELELGAHFKLELGGQYGWNLHIEHLIGEKAFANDIAFIEIGQFENDDKNLINMYNLTSFITI